MGKNKGNIEVKAAYGRYEIAITRLIKRFRSRIVEVYRLKDKIKDEKILEVLDKLTIDDGIIFFMNIEGKRERFLLMWQVKTSKKHIARHRNLSPSIIDFLLRPKARVDQIEKDLVLMFRRAFKDSIYKKYLPFYRR